MISAGSANAQINALLKQSQKFNNRIQVISGRAVFANQCQELTTAEVHRTISA